jgi:hypothetical protein
LPTILLLQVALPLVFLAWLWWRPLRSTFGLLVQICAISILVFALATAGLWLSLPQWLIAIYAALLLAGGLFAVRRQSREWWPRRLEWLAVVLLIAAGGFTGTILARAIAGRTPPPGTIVDLASPLRGERLLVANAGSTAAVNPHLMTLDPAVERFRPYRGQSLGVDLVRLNAAGRTTSGLRPTDPAAYEMFGDTVYAPCAGTVLSAREDRADMPVPMMDRSYLLGNHIILACGEAHVVLAHFRRGGVAVVPGDQVRTGEVLGEVGNSGNSQEPHLHIHAQTPGTASEPIAGDPLPIRIDGRYLVRGDRL